MLNVGEINLIGEFVEQAVSAGLARNIQACGNAVMIIEILKRELGPAQRLAALQADGERKKQIEDAVAAARKADAEAAQASVKNAVREVLAASD